jgi:hypothetical protein
VKRTQAPPGRFSATIVPPCASTMALQIASPGPYRRPPAPLAAGKQVEDLIDAIRGKTGAVIADGDFQ